ncbi:MAG TPA: hypothetical protein VGD01_01610 [Candidatus Elarobacter sp.]|jgi:hypothetical protein
MRAPDVFAVLLVAVALASAAPARPAVRAADRASIGYRYDQVERLEEVRGLELPSPPPFGPAYAAALARRAMFEHRPRRTVWGLSADEFDNGGGGRPSTWYVRADGTTRVDYGYFGRRIIMIFDPNRHELIWADPEKRTYRVYDTGPSDAFFTSADPRATPRPGASPTPHPVSVEPPRQTTIDGRAVTVYTAALNDSALVQRRADYVSALPRPPIVPFPGFYQAMDWIGIALGPSYREPPDGLVLFRAVAWSQMRLAQAFKKNPDVNDRTFTLLTCRRGNVAPLTAQDASVFSAPAGYRRDGEVAPSPKFTFGRDTDDFIAFHACDDVVARTEGW